MRRHCQWKLNLKTSSGWIMMGAVVRDYIHDNDGGSGV